MNKKDFLDFLEHEGQKNPVLLMIKSAVEDIPEEDLKQFAAALKGGNYGDHPQETKFY